jgi:enoyl-CoA hydratase/carnithine racemase
LAAEAVKVSPTTYELSKRVIWNALELPLGEAMQRGWEVLKAHQSHPDCFEGPRAWAEKRSPQWAVPDRAVGQP